LLAVALALVESARSLVGEARAVVDETRRLREQRARWREVWSLHLLQPSEFLICCAYCARMKTRDGRWITVPSGISEIMHAGRRSI
jgi:hypothetical protein